MGWLDKIIQKDEKPDLKKKEIEKIYARLGFTTQQDKEGNVYPVPKEVGTGVFGDKEFNFNQFLDLWLSSDYHRINDERYRHDRYDSYKQIDCAMSEGSMTLDAYADEVIGMGFVENILTVKVPGNKSLEGQIRETLDANNFFRGIRGIVRALCKFGDLGIRISRVNDRIFLTQIPPERWEAICFPDTRSVFRYQFTTDERKHQYDGLAGFFRKKLGMDQEKSLELWEFSTLSLADSEYYPYGRSILEPMRPVFDQLMTIEALLALTRASRVERMVMRVPTNQHEPAQAFQKLQQAKSLVKSIIYSYRDKRHAYGKIPSLTDWLIYPSDEGFDLDRMSGGSEITSIEDVEYFREKVILSTGLPQGYFISEEIIDRGNALTAQDLKFARKIIPIQQSLISGLTRLCAILAVYHGEDPEANDIRVEMKLPIQVNRDLAQHWSDVMTTGGSMMDLVREFLGSPEDEEGNPAPVVTEDTLYKLLAELGMPEGIIKTILEGRAKQKKVLEQEAAERAAAEEEDADGFGESARASVSAAGKTVISSSSRRELRRDPALRESLMDFDHQTGISVSSEEMGRLVEGAERYKRNERHQRNERRRTARRRKKSGGDWKPKGLMW